VLVTEKHVATGKHESTILDRREINGRPPLRLEFSQSGATSPVNLLTGDSHHPGKS
jgi:hypothetical protein